MIYTHLTKCSVVILYVYNSSGAQRKGDGRGVEEGLLDASDDSQSLHGATGTPTVGEK